MENTKPFYKIFFGIMLALSVPLALAFPIASWITGLSLGDFLDNALTIFLFVPFFLYFWLFLSEFSEEQTSAQFVRRLAVCAMLIALYIVLNRFVSITTPGFKIGFSVVCPMIAAMLFGPCAGAVVYGMGDLLSAVIFPFGVYHPGFTFTAILMGFIWGLFTHPEPFRRFINSSLAENAGKKRFFVILWILIPALLNCLVLGLFVNTVWVAQLYSKRTYWGWFALRLAEYAVMVPVNVLLAAAVLPLTAGLRKLFSPRKKRADAK